MLKISTHTKAVLQALFVVFLWATSWVLIKIGLQDIPALTFAGLRYTMAFLCMLPIMLFSRQSRSLRKISRNTWGRLALLGIIYYAITQGAVFVALAYLPAVTVNLLFGFSNIAVAVMGILFLAEYPTRFQWSGVLLAILGTLIYFYPVTLLSNQLFGILVAIIGLVANSGSSILGREINRRGDIHPLNVTTISMGIGSIPLLIAGIAVQGMPTMTTQGWIIIAWLAVVNTAFAFTLWNLTLRSLSAMESSIINGTMLIWIPILAVIFLQEQVSTKEVIGLVVVAIGTLFVQLRQPIIISSLLERLRIQ
jgi:drug/metabolite transporter (DMT)-like permease